MDYLGFVLLALCIIALVFVVVVVRKNAKATGSAPGKVRDDIDTHAQ